MPISKIGQMAFYADVMIHADAAKHREYAHTEFYKLIDEFLHMEGSFQLSLDSIPYAFVQYPEDLSFRTISWQLNKGEGEFEYYNFVQKNSGEVIEVIPGATIHADIDYESLQAKNYLPQLIYQVKQFGTGDSVSYMIFGYAQLDEFTKMKTVDVLEFTDRGIQFGKPIFENPSGPELIRKRRLVFQFSSDALMTAIYNPGLDMIVFDHLIQRMGRISGQGPTFLPDGSYCAYKQSSPDHWIYVEKLYDQILDEPPRTVRVTGDKTRDLFGRKKN